MYGACKYWRKHTAASVRLYRRNRMHFYILYLWYIEVYESTVVFIMVKYDSIRHDRWYDIRTCVCQ